MSSEWFYGLDKSIQNRLIDLFYNIYKIIPESDKLNDLENLKLRNELNEYKLNGVGTILNSINELEHKLEKTKNEVIENQLKLENKLTSNDKKGIIGERWIQDILTSIRCRFTDVTKKKGSCDFYCKSDTCEFLIESKNCEIVNKKHIQDFKKDVIYSIENDKNDINFAIFVAHRHKHFDVNLEFLPVNNKIIFLMYIADAFNYPDRLINGIDICKNLSNNLTYNENITNKINEINGILNQMNELEEISSDLQKDINKMDDSNKKLVNQISVIKESILNIVEPTTIYKKEVNKIAIELFKKNPNFTAKMLEEEISLKIEGILIKPSSIISNIGGINKIKEYIKDTLKFTE